MKLLLDTHTFIWWDSAPERLSRRSREVIGDGANELLLSVVSVWELQVKNQLGKLELERPLAELVVDQEKINGLVLLSVGLSHVLGLDTLPMLHRDPFDRLLIAQARVENAVLVTRDAEISEYDVETLW